MVQEIPHVPYRRIDRIRWPTGGFENLDFGKVSDSHVLRPIQQPEVWFKVKGLLKRMFTNETYLWVENYFNDFQKLSVSRQL